MFEGEALGLNAMYETKSIRVPKPFKVWNFKAIYVETNSWSSNGFYTNIEFTRCMQYSVELVLEHCRLDRCLLVVRTSSWNLSSLVVQEAIRWW